jgi:hypothetical protein
MAILKSWGLVGLILIILTQINFFLKIQPFALWYFPVIWLGYILFIDSLVYKINGKSLVSNNLGKLLGMFVISPLVWWMFEFFNISLNNWHYIGEAALGVYRDLFGVLSFAIVMPAFFETFYLIKAIFKYEEKEPKNKIKRKSAFVLITIGIILLLLTLIYPRYFFPFIWISVFLITDPINSLKKQPSLINKWVNKDYKIFGISAIAILIMGLFWEFWNYWAVIKWIYTVPFFDFLHIFEMPLLGYLGYIPFSFELYALYYLIRSFFLEKDNLK